MTVQTLADILIGVALIGWISYRQMTWRAVSGSRMWKMPAALAVVGVVMLAQTKSIHPLTVLDIVLLLVELVIALAVGALMGRIAVFRTRRAVESDKGDTHLSAQGVESVVESRTGWFGLALWIVLIAVRIGIDVLAVQMGAVLATATGVILLMVAANRAARVLVLVQRVSRNTGAASMIKA